VKAGFRGKSTVISHGVDTVLYQPMLKAQARKTFGLESLPEHAYVVGNVNRNQPRKRFDLTIEYFADWVKTKKLPSSVYLLLHCKLDDMGWDVIQLAKYYGVLDRLILTTKDTRKVPESYMSAVYGNIDVQISTTTGEGWGLTQHEGMACGIPQIVPEFAALGEWCKDAVIYIPCTSYQATTGRLNTIGGIPDKDKFIEALDLLYRRTDIRLEYSELAVQCATDDKFSWDTIAEQFNGLLTHVIGDFKMKAEHHANL
jgi:glycosyltransferase involved in cell wall biosynthesis